MSKILVDRARMLAAARSFFAERHVMEVDCPQLTSAASIDAHIDLIIAHNVTEKRFLHTSPEYAMKRLLVQGCGDIYQLGHVFREGEYGQRHNPEFTMAEWYRLNFTFAEMMQETVDFCRLLLGNLPSETHSYRQTFIHFTGLDPFTANNEDLLAHITKHQIPTYEGIENEDRDALLNIILGIQIEPLLGKEGLYVLAYYPSTQAALAKTIQLAPDEKAAERFEIYYHGIELANGYHELADPQEQRLRFLESNQHRVSLGKQVLPLDERFLQALEQGLPDCCGVAVGFDRLMMLRHQVPQLQDVLPFGWKNI